MSGEAATASRALVIAAVLVGLGLAVEVATLSWTHPTAFLAFAGVGGLLVGAGVVVYLWTLLAR